MNKKEYLEELRAALDGADKDEIARTLEFYSELIDDALEDGVSEEEAVSGLESPNNVAARIKSETVVEGKKVMHTALFITAVVLSSPIWLPVLVSVVAVIFSVYVSLWAVIVSLIAASIGAAAGSVAGVVTAVLMYSSSGAADSLFVLGASFAAAGIGVYLMYISVFAAKQYIKLSSICISKIRILAGKGIRRK